MLGDERDLFQEGAQVAPFLILRFRFEFLGGGE